MHHMDTSQWSTEADYKNKTKQESNESIKHIESTGNYNLKKL